MAVASSEADPTSKLTVAMASSDEEAPGGPGCSGQRRTSSGRFLAEGWRG
ncbi:uncharacterized protein J3R85_018464 [Psidium guajava]|nr:uncharacterized protein J3R85_018464 [Psidium guajava]